MYLRYLKNSPDYIKFQNQNKTEEFTGGVHNASDRPFHHIGIRKKNREYILHSVRCRRSPRGNLTSPEAQTAIDSIQIYDREKRFVL